ncbi:MAG: hypothetical protein FWF28_02760 [Micrococcales bacterium]|nr:hypothetical protein [Micrococcales bacterium]
MSPAVLADLAEYLPPEAALWRDIDPDTTWTLTDVLLAELVNLTSGANWQRAGDPHAPQPEPIPLPGQQPEGQHLTGDEMDIDEARDWLGWDF